MEFTKGSSLVSIYSGVDVYVVHPDILSGLAPKLYSLITSHLLWEFCYGNWVWSEVR